MFTGIITAIGTVQQTTSTDGGIELTIGCPCPDLELGESIAVDGACLTVERKHSGEFTVHVVRSSLDRTCLGDYAVGRRVNLERALRLGDRLGGHLVQGHVDGVGEVVQVVERQDARLLNIRVPDEVGRVSILLGSITVDGVSLTVNAKPGRDVIQISLIPFTLQHTTLSERREGDRVHLEADTIGKYVRAFLDNSISGKQ
jgi:riboflavin synthase